MGRYTGLIIVFMFLAAVVTGCTAYETPAPTASPGPTVTDYTSLVDSLRRAGGTVEPGDEVEQAFFSVKGRIIKLNGEDVQVFEYSDEAAAGAEAQLVSPDGGTIGTSSVFWVAPPHFFRAGKLIVLYVGETQAITGLLESVLGKQFAGR